MPPIPQQRPCCPEALLARYSGARDLSKLGTVYIQQQKERKKERKKEKKERKKEKKERKKGRKEGRKEERTETRLVDR